jgi:predicted acyltransferase (DUF342 family)
MYQMTGDVAKTRETADKLLSLATAHGFPSDQGLGLMIRGWALSLEDLSAGIDEIEAGFEQWRTTAGPLITMYYAILYSDALLRAGRREEAASVIDRAFAGEKGEKVFMPLMEKMRRELGI